MRTLAFAGVFVLLLILASSARSADRVATHSTKASEVLLRYEEVLPVGGTSGPSLTVYGDGRAVVHNPVFMKSRGTYEIRLTPTELKDLIDGVVVDGVVDFDPVEATRKLALESPARPRNGIVSESSDPSVTDIHLNLSRYVSEDGIETVNVAKRVRFKGLRERTGDAVTEIRALGRAQRRCRAIMEREGLRIR